MNKTALLWLNGLFFISLLAVVTGVVLSALSYPIVGIPLIFLAIFYFGVYADKQQGSFR